MGTVSSLSGATLEANNTTVCKFSSDPKLWDRLNEQASYMAECGPPFVEMLGMAHGRYWMKRYKAFNITDLPLNLRQAKQSLEPLWDTENPRYVDANWIKAHALRVRELCAMNDTPDNVLQCLIVMFEEVLDVRHRLTVCAATHGDATLANAVTDGDHIRWVDPIPPSIWLPAFKAVDLGKLLQSANGWEHFLNNRPPPPHTDIAVLENESPADVVAAKYFHALCYLRILRYTNEQSAVYEYAINQLYDCIS